MPEFRVINSLRDIEKQQWDVCFPGAVEDYNYLLAIEESALEGFSFRYLTAWNGSVLQSATPMFLTNYSLDTTLQGAGKKLIHGINNALPKLLTLRLACLGSPCTEHGAIGFHPQLDEQEKRALIADLLVCFETMRNHNRAACSVSRIFRSRFNGASANSSKPRDSAPCRE